MTFRRIGLAASALCALVATVVAPVATADDQGADVSTTEASVLVVESRDPSGRGIAERLPGDTTYLIQAEGLYSFGAGADVLADPECAQSEAKLDFRPFRYTDGTDRLDLAINGQTFRWTPSTPGVGPCDPGHSYQTYVRTPPEGTFLWFVVSDVNHRDNEGALTVRVAQCPDPCQDSYSTVRPDGTYVPPEMVPVLDRPDLPQPQITMPWTPAPWETVFVSARSDPFTYTTGIQVPGATYRFVVEGRYSWGDGLADAECSDAALAGDPLYEPARFGPELLDLTLNGLHLRWKPVEGSGKCSPSHTYEFSYEAVYDRPIYFRITEAGGASYDDNAGGLQVSIYETLPGQA